jgi:hypothetical protein
MSGTRLVVGGVVAGLVVVTAAEAGGPMGVGWVVPMGLVVRGIDGSSTAEVGTGR